jgi:hypothetical protein
MTAAQAEALVENILVSKEHSDYAKSQLIRASVSAKHVEGLIANINAIETEIHKTDCSYAVFTDLLQSINAHVDYLKSYRLVPKIDQLFSKVSHTKRTLQIRVFSMYREVGLISPGYTQNRTIYATIAQAKSMTIAPAPRPSITISNGGIASYAEESERILVTLQGAVGVVEQLGEDAVRDLMTEIVQAQMAPYEQAGRPGGSLYNLTKETVEARWSMARQLVADTEFRMGTITLKKWLLPHRMYISFAQRTAVHFRGLLQLEKEQSEAHNAELAASMSLAGEKHGVSVDVVNATLEVEVQEHVSLLVKVLRSSLAFEAEMTAHFEEEMMQVGGNTSDVEEVLGKLSEGNIISDVMDEFMDPYVKIERKNLEDTVKTLIAQDLPPAYYRKIDKDRDEDEKEGAASSSSNKSKVPGGLSKLMRRSSTDKTGADAEAHHPASPQAVEYGSYPSAGKMFELIKGSMKRILALTKGRPFYLLTIEYKSIIKIYADALKGFCPMERESSLLSLPIPNPIGAITNIANVGNASAAKNRPKITVEQESILCRVLNTADYCAGVVPRLQETLRNDMSYKYLSLVEFTDVVERFHDVISFGNNILVGGAMEKVEAALIIMRKIKWAELESVGDESAYLPHLSLQVIGVISRLREVLAASSFNHFCLSFMAEFLDCYLATIMNQKQICSIGAEQLLLDLNAIKALFSKLHHIEISAGSPRAQEPIPGPYNKISAAKFRKIEVVLKLICVEDDQFDEMIALMWPEHTPADATAVRELKHNSGIMSSAKDAGGKASKMVGAVGGSTKRAVGAVGTGSKKAFDSVRRASHAIGKFGKNKDEEGEEEAEAAVAAPVPQKSRMSILKGKS